MDNISIFSKHQALFLNSLRGLFRNPSRSIVVIICLVALLSPFVTAISICEGIKSQYSKIVGEGCDIYVTRDNYGSNAPVELDVIKKLQEIQGIIRIVPRIIGRTYVSGKFLAVLGVDSKSIPNSIHVIRGRIPERRGDVIIGCEAAEYLKLNLGMEFKIKRNPHQEFRIAGIFRSPFNVWNSDLLIMKFEDASDLFGLNEKATDLMVSTRPGYEQIVNLIINIFQDDESRPPLRVQTKDLIDRYSKRGFNIKGGVFSGFYCLVFALGIPAIGVISGFGQSERRKEIGVMKALGWQTSEVLEMVALENLILSIVSIPLVILATIFWIHILNGAFISRFFIANWDIIINFKIPSRVFPLPFVLCVIMAIVLTMVGSIYSTWRTAIVPPSEAMKT